MAHRVLVGCTQSGCQRTFFVHDGHCTGSSWCLLVNEVPVQLEDEPGGPGYVPDCGVRGSLCDPTQSSTSQSDYLPKIATHQDLATCSLKLHPWPRRYTILLARLLQPPTKGIIANAAHVSRHLGFLIGKKKRQFNPPHLTILHWFYA